MPLLGAGVLAIWNGIADGMEGEFLEWHVKEHIPERMALPGFLRARRYVAIDGEPAYFNFYEVSATSDLSSAAYLERLNNPTPWTRKVVASFTDTSRTICRVQTSIGVGAGSVVETMRFSGHDDAAQNAIDSYLTGLIRQRGIVAVHLLRGNEGAIVETSENKLRKEPDSTWAAVLIVEAVERDAILDLRSNRLSDTSLGEAGFQAIAGRGLYQLEFLLDAGELTR